MAYDNSMGAVVQTFTAAADLSAKQYYLVKLDGNGEVVVCAATSDIPVGVLQNKPTSGQAAQVLVCGISKVSSDAAIDEGKLLKTSADGQVAAVTPDLSVASGDLPVTGIFAIGVAYTASGGAGEIITAGINTLLPSVTFE